MQIREVGLEVCLVLMPGDAVDAWCRPTLQLVKRKAQQVDVHVVQERRQPDRLIPPCGATYAVHCLGYACPALRLVRAAQDRIALGPAPSLHRLRGHQLGLVRRLPWYYGRVRLPPAVHHRIGAFRLADADRPGGRARTASRWISRFPCRWLPRVQEVSRPRRAEVVLALAHHLVLPSAFLHSVGAPDGNFSRLNTPPACSPVNASPTASRPPTHDSGSS